MDRINEILNLVLFSVMDREITIEKLILAFLFISIIFVLYRIFIQRFFPKANLAEDISIEQTKSIRRTLLYILIILVIIVLIISLGLDVRFFEGERYSFKLSNIFESGLIILLARVVDWLISRMIIHPYYLNREAKKTYKKSDPKKEGEEKAFRTVQYLLYVVAAIIILRNFNWDITLLTWEETNAETGQAIRHPFRVTQIFGAVLVFLVARLFVWLVTQIFLYSYYRQKNINIGSQFAVNQLLKYIIYVIAAFVALDALGVKMTLVYGGAAALLVGIGLGLQQTFNDFFSGIILLFERTVEVGDTVQIGEMVGTVKKIGLRTSIIEARENISVIVPNSKLVVDNVINWSHFDDKARFKIDVGVAYGSDTEKVKELLLQAAADNPYIIDYPAAFVRFINFGESSLDFELHFWSRNFIIIEDVRSDLRFKIDELFRANEINIPFPQRDVNIRKD
ncbi:MAG: mechanosensitive ion channel domain-containing protein, partial [Bacteroidota bacterium]